MEIRHHIGFNTLTDLELEEAVKRFDIDYKKSDIPGDGGALITFQISEDAVFWEEIHRLVEKYSAINRVETYFSEEEILKADYLRLIVRYETGFPEPRDTWITDPINYENFCRNCGTYEQKSSFRIQSEPNLRQYNFMTFAWAATIFCRYEVENELRNAGINDFETLNIINLSTGEPSTKILQIKAPRKTSPGLISLENMEKEECSDCRKIKHSFHLRGVMKYRRSEIPPDADIIESYEWFGVGSKRAFRELFVSNRFARLAINRGWKSIRFKVIEPVD